MNQVQYDKQNDENAISTRDFLKLLGATTALVGFNGLAVAGDLLKRKKRNYQYLRPEEILMAGNKPWDKWKYSGGETRSYAGREGLANILGAGQWSGLKNGGVRGVDFGHRSDINAMRDLKQTPYWDSKNKRLFLFDGARPNIDGGFKFEKSKLIGGSINHVRNDGVPLELVDCYLDADADKSLIYGVSQPTALRKPGYLSIKNSTIRGFKLAQVNMCHGEIINSNMEFSAADILIGGWSNNQIPDKSRSLYFQGNLMRLPANKEHAGFNPGAHADIYQVNNQHYTSLVGNTLYMPSTGSGYDEGSIGTTSALANGSIMRSNEVFNIGNILVGGAYTIYLDISPTDNAFIKNHAYVNNIMGAGGQLGKPLGTAENYSSFGEFNLNSGAGGSNRVWKNILFWNNMGSDGYPVRISGRSVPHSDNIPQAVLNAGNAKPALSASGREIGAWANVNGIFNYDKDELTPRMIELLLAIGDGAGTWVIDEKTLKLNPLFDLGNLKV